MCGLIIIIHFKLLNKNQIQVYYAYATNVSTIGCSSDVKKFHSLFDLESEIKMESPWNQNLSWLSIQLVNIIRKPL